MKDINFNQVGGFPLTTDILNGMQVAYKSLQAFGALAGDKTIISGCQEIGNRVNDGYVYLGGKLYFFRGNLKQSKVIIVETPTQREFENGDVKTTEIDKFLTFGTGANAIDWADFKRIDPLTQMMVRMNALEKKAAVFTSGGAMVFWNKPASEIPEGWQEVVDWRGRMPVGFNPNDTDFNTLGKEGGSKTKRLSVPEMPEHDHEMLDGKHSDSGGGYLVSGSGNTQSLEFSKTKKTGGGQAFSILNPYRVVMFIEYVG